MKAFSVVLALLISMAPHAPCQETKAVTDAEKKEFLKLLSKLPARGEFYTEEAVTEAGPYLRVLLALTEKDIDKYPIYPFAVLSRQLGDRKEHQVYAVKHFDNIAHPLLRLSWAVTLFNAQSAPPEIVKYLHTALESKEQSRTLAEMLGPAFNDFKEEVIRTSEAGKLMKIELVKEHSTKAFPKFDVGFDYTHRTYVFAPGPLVYAVRPFKQRGELIRYDVMKGTTSRLVIPQPKGFKAEFDFAGYFDNPVLSINSRGDLLCRWTIDGNGDHGIALLKKGSDTFLVKRLAMYLGSCRVVAAPDGAWHLIQMESGGNFVVFQIDHELKLTNLGEIRRPQHSALVDARFISKEILHLFCWDRDKSFTQRLRLIDFDVKERKVLHNREFLKLDAAGFGISIGGTLVHLNDGSLHYVWGIDDWRLAEEKKAKGQVAGLYYQAETDATTLKVSGGHEHIAVAVGNRVIVRYTEKNAPDKVSFRVIRHGTLGPVTDLAIAKGREHNLSSEYMTLYSETDRIWFVNTLAPNTLYELKLVDAKKQ
jgi:hypothetical protein